jgi:hypothetical protein
MYSLGGMGYRSMTTSKLCADEKNTTEGRGGANDTTFHKIVPTIIISAAQTIGGMKAKIDFSILALISFLLNATVLDDGNILTVNGR